LTALPDLVPKKAFLLGDGITANLMACVLLRHGIAVTLYARPDNAAPSRSVHVHSVAERTLHDFGAFSGRMLRGFEIGAAFSVKSETSVERLAHRPIVDLAFTHEEIAHQADVLGLVRAEVTSVRTDLSVIGPAWSFKSNGQFADATADILVDASGSSRCLCDWLEHSGAGPIFVDEGGPPSFYQTFVGNGPCDLLPLTIVFQAPARDGRENMSGLIAFHRNGQTRITLKGNAWPKHSIQSVIAVINAITAEQLPFEAEQRLASARWADGSTHYTSFGARRLALEEADLDHLPPCFAIGDALIQTPPSQGQGLAQLAAQLGIIETALAGGKGLSTIKQDLGAAAYAAWLSSIMRATAQDIRPAPQTLATPVPLEGPSSL
jgi:hypothetical protein